MYRIPLTPPPAFVEKLIQYDHEGPIWEQGNRFTKKVKIRNRKKNFTKKKKRK